MAGGPGGGQDQDAQLGGMSPGMANLLGLALLMSSKGIGGQSQGATIGAQLLGQGMQEGQQAKLEKARRAEQQARESAEMYKLEYQNPDLTAIPQAGVDPLIPGENGRQSLWQRTPPDLSGLMGENPEISKRFKSLPPQLQTTATLKFLTEQETAQQEAAKRKEMGASLRGLGQSGPAESILGANPELAYTSGQDITQKSPPRMPQDLANILAQMYEDDGKIDNKLLEGAFKPQREIPPPPPNFTQTEARYDKEGNRIDIWKPPVPEKPEVMSEEWKMAYRNVGVDIPGPGQKLSPQDSKKVTTEYNRLQQEGHSTQEAREGMQETRRGTRVSQAGNRFKDYEQNFRRKYPTFDTMSQDDWNILNMTDDEYKARYGDQATRTPADVEDRRLSRQQVIIQKVTGGKPPTAQELPQINAILHAEGWKTTKVPNTSKLSQEKLTEMRDALEQQAPAKDNLGKTKRTKVDGVTVNFTSDGTQWNASVE